jgi:galactonate dehydratase
MKIIDLKTYVVELPPKALGGRHWIFLKLITDDGIEGIGEPVRVGFETQDVVQLIHSVGARYIIDSDPFKIEKMWRKIYSGTFRPGAARMGILSGFEMACWDIIGKALEQPIYNLLGGQYHEKLRSYTYMYPFTNDSTHTMWDIQADPELAADRAAGYVKQGFTAIKFDPAPPVMVDAPIQLSLKTLVNAEAVVRSVREAVGDKCDICIGTHGQMTTSSAIRLARRLEKFDPLWFEEPIPPENRDEMARVARQTTIPVATGERLYTKYEFGELLQRQAASILQFTVGSVGGILEAKKVAGMAEACYAQIAPHFYAGPVVFMANVQIDTCSPNFLMQESVETFDGFYSEILKDPIRWEEGYIIPPTKPGLGIEFNEEVLKKHLYTGD